MIPITDRTWTPRTPPPRLVRQAVQDAPRWRAYLVGQGYTPGELPGVLEGRQAEAPAPGLVAAAEARVAELELQARQAGAPLELDQVAEARAGAVRVYLEVHPPRRVLELDPRPVAALDRQAFGARLVPVEAGPGSVQVLEDLVTGRRWWTVGETGARAGLAVIAGALFRLVGVGAPAARLVELEGERLAVHPAPVAWEPFAGQVLELQAAAVRAELPADAWVAYRGGLPGLRGRPVALPAGMFTTLRLALGSTLGRAGGRAAPTWGVEIPELQELRASRPWAGARPQELAASAERVAAVTESEVRQAVALGELEAPEAAKLSATLLGRRDLVAHAVLDLITGARRGR